MKGRRYLVNYDIKKLQEVQLELLDELIRICSLNNITFYLAAGSCIGAVRHHGFIPWDDDIDVFMYADDVDRLFRCADQFGNDFFLQNKKTDPGFGSAIARLRKNGTVCIERDEIEGKCHQGIFLDIYILYYYPNNILQRALMVERGIRRNILLMERAPINHGKFIKILGNIILLPYHNELKRNLKVQDLTKKIRKFKNTDKLVILYGMDISIKRIISYKTVWFGKPVFLQFEGRKVPVATNFDAYLKCRYGDDYMVLPPKEKRHSYHEYKKISF